MIELWWHLFVHENEEIGTLQLMLGGSTEHPEALIARRGLKPEFDISLLGLEGAPFTYVRSWNREPSEVEVEALLDRMEESR